MFSICEDVAILADDPLATILYAINGIGITPADSQDAALFVDGAGTSGLDKGGDAYWRKSIEMVYSQFGHVSLGLSRPVHAKLKSEQMKNTKNGRVKR